MTPAEIRAIADAKAARKPTTAQHGGVLDQVSRFFTRSSAAARPAVADAGAPHHPAADRRPRALAHRGQRRRRPHGPGDQQGRHRRTTRTGEVSSLTVTCAGGEVPCTIGDMNALPDFFGSFDDLSTVSKSIVFKTFQVIRRETYIYLKDLKAKLQGLTYSYDAKTTPFGGLAGNNVSLSRAPALPDFGNAAADVMATTTMLAGTGGEQGLDASVGADATLGRNACHFPPESWLRWREHHMRARALIASAATTQDLAQKANDAIGHERLRGALPAGLLRRRAPDQQGLRHGGRHGARQRWRRRRSVGMTTPPRSGALQTGHRPQAAYRLPGGAQPARPRGQADSRLPATSLDDRPP